MVRLVSTPLRARVLDPEPLYEEVSSIRGQLAETRTAIHHANNRVSFFQGLADIASQMLGVQSLASEMQTLKCKETELQQALNAAETRLKALVTAETVAAKAQVLPFLDLKEAVTSWVQVQDSIRVSLVLSLGSEQQVWPLSCAVSLARQVLQKYSDRVLLEFEGLTRPVLFACGVARAVLEPPQLPTLTAFDALREVVCPSGEICVAADIHDAVNGPLGVRHGKGAELPVGFAGRLRNYQLDGYRWLSQNSRNGFGSLLADDMGLGKTIQAVCLISHLVEQDLLRRPCLVVAPVSLIRNWRREFLTWAPTLKVSEYVGTSRVWPRAANVVLTSYGIVRTCMRAGAKHSFGCIGAMVLDEAQTIKNHKAEVSVACKKLAAACPGIKVALSGTPVENRLEEIHSIFEFAVPGYLGTLKEFKIRYTQRKGDADATKLRKLIDPFMLRRVKTDPAICPELPPKVDMRHDVTLTRKQQLLYNLVYEKSMESIRKSSNRQDRSAHIFGMIHGLRKVCNHPLTFGGLVSGFDESITDSPDESGKTVIFLELLRDVFARGEKCLVFVQYLNTIELLQRMVTNTFGVEVATITGSVDAEQRAATVERFQNYNNCRICFATVGAGGVGLNLTAASHVVHFDRCYNPAVEDQASDRAHRIGQQSTVIIHRLITENTFEERIDAIMQAKQHLREICGAGGAPTWLADFSDDDIRSMFLFGPSKETREPSLCRTRSGNAPSAMSSEQGFKQNAISNLHHQGHGPGNGSIAANFEHVLLKENASSNRHHKDEGHSPGKLCRQGGATEPSFSHSENVPPRASPEPSHVHELPNVPVKAACAPALRDRMAARGLVVSPRHTAPRARLAAPSISSPAPLLPKGPACAHAHASPALVQPRPPPAAAPVPAVAVGRAEDGEHRIAIDPEVIELDSGTDDEISNADSDGASAGSSCKRAPKRFKSSCDAVC